MQLQLHSNLFLLQFLSVFNRANVLLYFGHKNFTSVKIFIKLFTRYLGNKLSSLKPSVKSITILSSSNDDDDTTNNSNNNNGNQQKGSPPKL